MSAKRKTPENFIKNAKKVHGNKYDYSKTKYIKTSIKIIITCPRHGDFKQGPYRHLSGSGCKTCGLEASGKKGSRTRTKTQEQFLKEAKTKHGNRYDYSLVHYLHTEKNIKIICPEHGEFKQIPNSHLKGCGCPRCAQIEGHKKLPHTHTATSFIKRAKEIHSKIYNYSRVEYINNHTKIKIICRQHGEFEQTPNVHLSRKGCPGCGKITKAEHNTKDITHFLKKAKEAHGNKYDYSKTVYIKSAYKVIITCPTHGDFKQAPHYHILGKGCLLCKESKGEIKIAKFLDKNNIKYEREKTFETCRVKNKLPFDFHIPKEQILIEFDGEQHYKKLLGNWGPNVNLDKIQARDKIKTKWAKDNNYTLIRIKYTKFNSIKKILTEKLKIA